MALVVRDNSPLIGYIEWTGLSIQYLGVTYAIADGFTQQRYVWWDPAVSTTALQAAATLPALSDDSVLLFLNKDGVHVTVPKSTVVEGSLIVSESVLANALAANAVTADKIAAGAVVADKLAAWDMVVGQRVQSMDYNGTDVATGNATAGFRIEAGGKAEFNDVRVRGDVKATRFQAVEGTTNLLAPGTFEGGLEGWTNGGTASVTVSQDSAVKHSGTYSLKMVKTATMSNAIAKSPSFAVEAGRGYRLNLWTYITDLAVDANPGIAWFDSGGTLITTEYIGGASAVSTWTESHSNILIAPTGAVTAQVWVRESAASATAGTWYVDDVTVLDAPMVRSGGFQSDSAAKRIEIASNDLVEFKWSPFSTQDKKAGVSRYLWNPGAAGEYHQIELGSGSYQGRKAAQIRGESEASDASRKSRITLNADNIYFNTRLAPLGSIGYGTDPNARNGIGSGFYEFPGTSMSMTLVAGRLYKATVVLNKDQASGNGVIASVMSGGGEHVRVIQDNANTASGITMSGSAFFTGSGAYTFSLGARSPFGTINVNGHVVATTLVVEDVGQA